MDALTSEQTQRSAATIKTANIDPEGWKKGRRSEKGIGGSDIAKVLGLHPKYDAYSLWVRKTNLSEPEDISGLPRIKAGNRLEPVILDMYEDDTGRPIERLGKVLFRSVDRPWEIVSPDALCKGESRGVEVKNVATDRMWEWGEQGTDGAPAHYLLQAAWGAMVIGRDAWDIAAFIGGWDFRIYTYQRDRELEQMMREAAEQFWKLNVIGGEPPQPMKQDSIAHDIHRRFPRSLVDVKRATDDQAARIREIVAYKARKAELEKTIEKMQNALKMEIGDSSGLIGAGVSVSWKNNRDSVSIQYEEIARELLEKLPAEEVLQIVDAHTITTPGARPFRTSAKEK